MAKIGNLKNCIYISVHVCTAKIGNYKLHPLLSLIRCCFFFFPTFFLIVIVSELLIPKPRSIRLSRLSLREEPITPFTDLGCRGRRRRRANISHCRRGCDTCRRKCCG